MFLLLFFLFLLLLANEQLLNPEPLSLPSVQVGVARKPVLHVQMYCYVLHGMWPGYV